MRETMGADPFSGAVYVFRAKRADRVKMIFWDGTGVCLFAFNNASLLVDRPPPTPAKAADDLDPPQRSARLERMVKSRHKTILHGPSDSTFTPRQRRCVRDHAYLEARQGSDDVFDHSVCKNTPAQGLRSCS